MIYVVFGQMTLGAGEVSQLMKCLLYTLCSDPLRHVKESGMMACVCNFRAEEEQTGGS